MVRGLRRSVLLSDSAVWSGGAAWYLAAYVLMQFSGLFGPPPPNIIRALHLWPALIGIVVIMAGSLTFLLGWTKSADRKPSGLMQKILIHSGLLIAGVGILLSSMTRFEGSLVLSEGQSGEVLKADLDPYTMYMRKFSRLPRETFTVLDVKPFSSGSGRLLSQREARVSCRDSGSSMGRELVLTSALPRRINGFFYQIANVGYSPRCQLFDAGGEVIADAYVVMDLYPPGSEDSFRLSNIPHTFYLRYYPDVSMVPDKGGLPTGAKGPIYKVRVSRNLDMIVNTYASPHEVIPVDALFLSLPDVRRWVEIRIISDPGLYLMFPGVAMVIAGGLVAVVGKITKVRKGEGDAY